MSARHGAAQCNCCPRPPASLWLVVPGTGVIWYWNLITSITQVEANGSDVVVGFGTSGATDVYKLLGTDGSTVWHTLSGGSPVTGFMAGSGYFYLNGVTRTVYEFNSSGTNTGSVGFPGPVTCVDGGKGGAGVVISNNASPFGGGAVIGWIYDTPLSLGTGDGYNFGAGAATPRSGITDGTLVWFGTDSSLIQWTRAAGSLDWTASTGGRVNAVDYMGGDVYAACSLASGSLRKYDATGALAWSWTSGNSLFDVSCDGTDIWVCGIRTNTWTGNSGNFACIWKLDSSGNVLWSWDAGVNASKIGVGGGGVFVGSGTSTTWNPSA